MVIKELKFVIWYVPNDKHHALPCGVSRKHFMWIAFVRPEEDESVEDGVDVGDDVLGGWVDLKSPSFRLQVWGKLMIQNQKKKKIKFLLQYPIYCWTHHNVNMITFV